MDAASGSESRYASTSLLISEHGWGEEEKSEHLPADTDSIATADFAVHRLRLTAGFKQAIPNYSKELISKDTAQAHRGSLGQRLKAANARVGALTISLMWDNRNDLDIHCKSPTGSHIYCEFSCNEFLVGNCSLMTDSKWLCLSLLCGL